MAPPAATLSPPKSDPIPASLLAQHDGSDPSKPIWLAIKGTVFDVSAKRAMYGPGAGYNVFAGKDGSVGLGEWPYSQRQGCVFLRLAGLGVVGDGATFEGAFSGFAHALPYR